MDEPLANTQQAQDIGLGFLLQEQPPPMLRLPPLRWSMAWALHVTDESLILVVTPDAAALPEWGARFGL